MAPSATMITPAQPPSQAISSPSMYTAFSKSHGGSSDRWSDDSRKMPTGEPSNQSERMFQTNNGYCNGDGDEHDHHVNINMQSTNGTSNRMANGGTYNHIPSDNGNGSEPDEIARDQSAQQEQQLQHSDESSQQDRNLPLKEPLHKTLYDDFDKQLTSLREATIEALSLSCQEQERLCLQGEELEVRIAYMRKKIDLAKGKLLEKGTVSREMEDEFQLNLVREGESDEIEGSRHSGLLQTLDENFEAIDENDAEPSSTSTMRRTNSGKMPLHKLPSSKRFSNRSSLHTSQTSQMSSYSRGSSTSDGTSMPHMSRGSLLGMLGASKSWLDNYANTASENNNDESARGSTSNFRPSFMDGASDGMPSRWRAREQEREQSAKQKEEEEQRLQEKTIHDERNGLGGIICGGRPKIERTKEERLQDLIFQREEQIFSLEERAGYVEKETSTLRDEISTLQKDQQQTQDDYEDEKAKLLEELDQVDYDNERLDHMLVETGVSLEEKKIIIEILANELKGAREELANIQNEMDRRRAERKRRERSRRWSWMRGNSSSSLMSSNDTEQKPQEQQERPQSSSSPQGQGQGQGNVQRYQVPVGVMQQYRTLVNSSDDDDSGDNDISGSGSGGNRRLDRRQSHASVGTCMSSLTLDSGELVDILEQLELDDE